MARGHIVELGLGGESFNSRSSSRALLVRRTAACAACLLAACVASVALARGQGDAAASLSENNKYEESNSFDAEWNVKDLQHHLVQTQRMMTTDNKEIAKGISKLDRGVEILMHLLKHRPAGDAGVSGEPGEPGPKGAPGAKGENGPDGAPGAPGAAGVAGRGGVPGTPGAAGPAGAAGNVGRAGNPGPTGVVGKAGPQGPEGQRGQQGRKGRHGWEGPPGPAGVPAYLHAVHHYPYEDTDTSGAEDAAKASDGEYRQTSSNVALRSAQHRQEALRQTRGLEGDAEAAYKRTLRLGWKKEEDVSVAQVRINGDRGYEVHVAAPRGDAIRATLRGEDGFDKTWKGTSSLVSGAIAAGAPGSADFLKVTDRTRDETQYFKLAASQ